MAIPQHYEILKEVLESLKDGEIHPLEETRNYIANCKKVSKEERSVLIKNGSMPVFNYRILWTRTHLKSAGLIHYPKRGFSQITNEGRKVLEENPQPLDTKYLTKYKTYRTFVGLKEKDSATENSENINMNQTPQESIEEAFDQINSVLGDELLNEILNLSPTFFEHLAVKLLEKMGYIDGVVTQRSRDKGIDGIICEDKLGFTNIFIQAKRLSPKQKVGLELVQRFVGAITNKGGKGVFITTTEFTKDAITYAKENNLVLINGNRLTNLMIEYNVAVTISQTYELKKIDTDFFEE